jgi:two-component system OmpR family response regulator
LDKAPINNNQIVNISDILINFDTKQAEVNGNTLNLTVMELSLLYYLVKNKNRAISRSELLDKVWGFENKVETRATDDMIKRIRKKLSDVGSKLKIDTIWGFGFTIKDEE